MGLETSYVPLAMCALAMWGAAAADGRYSASRNTESVGVVVQVERVPLTAVGGQGCELPRQSRVGDDWASNFVNDLPCWMAEEQEHVVEAPGS